MTPKQQRFCDEYLIDLNATQAAIRAGYSEKTAAVIGCENLIKPNIQQYIAERQKVKSITLEITQNHVLEGYRRLAFYDARRFYDESGQLKGIPDLDDETAFALTGFEFFEERGGNGEGQQVVLGYTKKIKMSDRRAALDSICRVLGYNAPTKLAKTDSEGRDVAVYDYSALSTEELMQLKEINKKCAITQG